MPYITKTERKKFEGAILSLKSSIDSSGQLNYVIYRLLKEYAHRNNVVPNYDRYNAIMGVLSCLTREFYAKEIRPYEELKEKENGPINLFGQDAIGENK